jgi:hypothetical protein
MMLEAGQSEARGLAYIAETKKLIPNKPIRYVVNTHPHSDHTGGLPALVAEGATIITQKNNEKFLEEALNTPRTLLTDTLAKNPEEGEGRDRVGQEDLLGWDANRRDVPRRAGAAFERLADRLHSQEKILFQGDFSLPAPGQPGNDHVKALVPIPREAQSRFRSLHQRAHVRGTADQGRALEGRREIARNRIALSSRQRRPIAAAVVLGNLQPAGYQVLKSRMLPVDTR